MEESFCNSARLGILSGFILPCSTRRETILRIFYLKIVFYFFFYVTFIIPLYKFLEIWAVEKAFFWVSDLPSFLISQWEWWEWEWSWLDSWLSSSLEESLSWLSRSIVHLLLWIDSNLTLLVKMELRRTIFNNFIVFSNLIKFNSFSILSLLSVYNFCNF